MEKLTVLAESGDSDPHQVRSLSAKVGGQQSLLSRQAESRIIEFLLGKPRIGIAMWKLYNEAVDANRDVLLFHRWRETLAIQRYLHYMPLLFNRHIAGMVFDEVTAWHQRARVLEEFLGGFRGP